MHDVLHELVLREAESENLFYVKKDGVMSLKHGRKPTNYPPKAQQWITQSRTSCCHHLDPFHFSSVLWFPDHIFFKLPSAVNFKLLRVLVLLEIDKTSTLKQIMSLVHLRTLRFRTVLLIRDLPWYMLSNLKILAVGGQIECEENLFAIWGLPQLRHLCFDNIYRQFLDLLMQNHQI